MSTRAVGIAVVIALVPAAGYALKGAFDGGSGSPSSHSSSTVPPIPPVSTPVTTPVTTPTTTAPSAPTTTAAPPLAKPPKQPHLPHVALDVPRKLLSKGLLNVGFDDSIEPKDGTFRARSTAEVARWGSRGEPGSPAKDTVYVVGKSFTKGVSAFDTLPKIKKGATIVIRTDSGDLTYTVHAISTLPTAGLAKRPAILQKAPGRLVVIGLGYDRAGHLTGKATVVVAEISGAIAR